MLLPDFPTTKYTFYAAVDPGFSGAVALMNAAGTTCRTFDMPVKTMGKTEYRALDLDGLKAVFAAVKHFPDVVWGLENPTTRPGEGAERCFRFGRQVGVLESFIHLHGFDYCLIAPARWKSRLNLPGKEKDPRSLRATEFFDTRYPSLRSVIRGPRGGILDGRLDALLICHSLRTEVLAAKYSEFVAMGKKLRQDRLGK